MLGAGAQAQLVYSVKRQTPNAMQYAMLSSLS